MLKKLGSILLLTFFVIFFIANVNAEALTIQKKAINDVVAIELNIPTKYEITVTNKNSYDDYIDFVVLVNANITPEGKILVPAKQSKTIIGGILPLDRFKGNFMYEYYIRGEKSGATQDKMFIKMRPLSDILSVSMPQEITREDPIFPVQVVNKENINLSTVLVTVSSSAFTTMANAFIDANSNQTIDLPLDTGKLKTVEAGTYDFKLTFLLNNEYNYTIEKQIKLREFSNIVSESSTKRSFFGYTKTLTKKNNGNIKQLVTIELYQNPVEKVFSQFSLDSTSSEKSGSKTLFKWQRQIQPGESFVVVAKTDYTIPIVILALIIIAIVAYVIVKQKKVIVSKKALRVQTKGGEFASKIVLLARNVGNSEVGNITLIDRLPLTTQIYEKFGTVKPDKVEKHRLEWKFPSLLPGEEVVVSYIIYSKIKMLGTIELPRATFHCTNVKNKRLILNSNKIFVRAG
jgi:hypothetical protein